MYDSPYSARDAACCQTNAISYQTLKPFRVSPSQPSYHLLLSLDARFDINKLVNIYQELSELLRR